jgi:hypothetical protein
LVANIRRRGERDRLMDGADDRLCEGRKSKRRACCRSPAGLDKGVTFKWKDYRREGRERYAVMTLDTHEFIRRFLMHVLPQGFHRIRYSEAASEGGWFGLGGTQVSEAEKATLGEISGALRLAA